MSAVAERFACRHRRKIRDSARYSGKLLLFGLILLAGTVGPTWLLWWNTALPAAIATAIAALILVSVMMMLPLELIAYVDLQFDRDLKPLPFPGIAFGRRLYRDSGRLDAMAREANLPPLSDFESPDVLDTRKPPVWHRPEAALPTLEYLLTRVDPRLALHRELRYVQAALRAAIDAGASFYLLLHTWAGFTNAEIHALRRGERPASPGTAPR